MDQKSSQNIAQKDQLLTQGMEDFNNEQYNNAMENFSNALKCDPSNVIIQETIALTREIILSQEYIDLGVEYFNCANKDIEKYKEALACKDVKKYNDALVCYNEARKKYNDALVCFIEAQKTSSVFSDHISIAIAHTMNMKKKLRLYKIQNIK